MNIVGTTHIGLVRQTNQDCFKWLKKSNNDFIALVCDGIGGAKGGETASSMCSDYLYEQFNHHEPFSDQQSLYAWVEKHINIINKAIYELANTSINHQGMGTTLVALIGTGFGHYVVNIGDSRCYSYNQAVVQKCITIDHNVYHDLIRFNHMKAEDAAKNLKKDYLTRAVGISDIIQTEIFKVDEIPSYYLLCSDGLHGYVDDNLFSMIIQNNNFTLKDKINCFVDTAIKVGGYDNITVVLVEVKGEKHG